MRQEFKYPAYKFIRLNRKTSTSLYSFVILATIIVIIHLTLIKRLAHHYEQYEPWSCRMMTVVSSRM